MPSAYLTGMESGNQMHFSTIFLREQVARMQLSQSD